MDIEKELQKTAQALVRTNGSRAPESEEPPRYDFVSLGEKVGLAMVQAAEDQVTQAQNKLKEVQAWADGLSQQVRAKDRELADMTDRIRAFGETVLEANRRFHGTLEDRRETDRS